MWDACVAGSPAQNLLSPNMTARENWERLAKQYTPRGATATLNLFTQFEEMHADDYPNGGVEELANAIIEVDRQLRQIDPNHGLKQCQLNFRLITLCRQKKWSRAVNQVMFIVPNVLDATDDTCYPFYDLRKMLADLNNNESALRRDTQQNFNMGAFQTRPLTHRGGAPNSQRSQ